MIKKILKVLSPKSKKKQSNNNRNELVILIHGIMSSSIFLSRIGLFLRSKGYKVYFHRYPSTRHSINAHSIEFMRAIEKLAAANQGCRINIVSHSMGGLITRKLLENIYSGRSQILTPDSIKRIVMIAPPNKGSALARFFSEKTPFLNKFLIPLQEMSNSKDSPVHEFYDPSCDFETGIIAASLDNKVSVASTHLKSESAHITFRSTHNLVLYSKKTCNAVFNFIQDGSFCKKSI